MISVKTMKQYEDLAKKGISKKDVDDFINLVQKIQSHTDFECIEIFHWLNNKYKKHCLPTNFLFLGSTFRERELRQKIFLEFDRTGYHSEKKFRYLVKAFEDLFKNLKEGSFKKENSTTFSYK